MKQEFVTVYGKVIIENCRVYVRTYEAPFSKTAFAQVGFELGFLLIFVLQFFIYHGTRQYIGIIIWGVLLLGHLKNLFDVLFKRSYANRIPFDRIQSIRIDEDNHGLHTYVILNLKNGRYRKIQFRKLENQYQPFAEAILQCIIPSQFA